MWSLNGLFSDLAETKKEVYIAENHEHTKTDSLQHVKYLSLKSHHLWVTLYLEKLISKTYRETGIIWFLRSISQSSSVAVNS